jgi:hypothetical protein
MYRAGSRIRVRISAPNGDQPVWSFGETDPAGQSDVAIGYGGNMPSRLLLPVVPGVTAPTGLPPCPGLRGEPCRDFAPLENRAVDPETPGGDPGISEISGTSGVAGATQTGAVKKKCKKRKRGKKAAVARNKCRRT